MRTTVHLFPTEDFGWLTSLYGERIARAAMGRLETIGMTVADRDRALAVIRKAIQVQGSITRTEAMEAAQRAGVEIDAGRRTLLSVAIVTSGSACIGPDHGRGGTFVDTREWVGSFALPDREDALAELATRYFAAFAPATERDFAKWSGLPLGECRIGMGRIAGRLKAVGASEQALFAPSGFDTRLPRSPVVRLLSLYDTYLMGYVSRSHAVDEAGEKVIRPGGGVLRPTICVDGRFVGTWSRMNARDGVTLVLEPFAPLDESWLSAIEREAADIARFDGHPKATVVASP